MGVNITLRTIRNNWNPAKVKRDSRSFLLQILPDCYSENECMNNAFVFEEGGMSKASIDALFRGNRQTLKSTKQATPKFTEDFICGLTQNPLLDFRDKGKHRDNNPDSFFRGNMFAKIFSAVDDMGTPASGEHPLFSSINFSDVWENTPGEIAEEFLEVNKAISILLEKPTKVSISYAIFLLVVTAIVQDRISEVSFLYKSNSLEQVYKYENGERLIDTPSQKHGPFYDPYYFNHTYHVYKFREASGKLWEECTLRMDQQPNGRPVATLQFRDGITSPIVGDDEINRKYEGTPMYSPADEMVFIAMADQKDTFLLLAMPYHEFKFAPMYFRSGFILKAAPSLGVPKTQKIAITAKAVPPSDIPYIEGLLKLDNDQLYLSARQREEFLIKFEKYSWMNDFKENYLPLFGVHQKKSGLYHFNSDEILSCSMSNLDRNDRIRILLALKSMDASNNPDLYKYVLCDDPKGVHKIFKYGAVADPEQEDN